MSVAFTRLRSPSTRKSRGEVSVLVAPRLRPLEVVVRCWKPYPYLRAFCEKNGTVPC
jgi:hypothetical protein